MSSIENHRRDGTATDRKNLSVGLFVTCLVDLFRPSVGYATVELLQQAGCSVTVPASQTCCGQPAYNSGDNETSQAIARQVISTFENFDYVVAPSGSCAAMLREHYPSLLEDDPKWSLRATAMAERCHELLSFLTDIVQIDADALKVQFNANCTYHDSCSGLRELGIHPQPRLLLQAVAGLSLTEMKDSNVCCGFGGTFCIKYPEISARMVTDKTTNIAAAGVDTVLGGDLGCLMNIAGRLSREASDTRVYHVAEVLSGIASRTPPIGVSEEKSQRSGTPPTAVE